jgi:glycosyltransferase involved in cell wall biosynthesis
VSTAAGALDLTVYVPAYNEELLIGKTLDTIFEALDRFPYSYEILIYDDASTDRTSAVAGAYIREHGLENRVFVIRREVNPGLGKNFLDAARRGRGEYFIMVAGDDSEPAETLRRVLNLLGKADVIIPYFDTRLFDMRFNGDNRTFFRRLVSLLFAALVRIISGLNMNYFNGCILHKRQNILDFNVETYGLAYQPELICKILSTPGTSFLEVKVYNRDRAGGGTTAFKLKNVRSVAGSLWRILISRRFSKTPMNS